MSVVGGVNDERQQAVEAPLVLSEAVNDVCPWSGKPVSENSLTRYRGRVVGFCNPGCRDKFELAIRALDTAIDKAD